MNQTIILNAHGERAKFIRKPSNFLGGVCEGLASAINIPPGYLRVLWALSAFFSFGGTLAVYLILWIFLPRENDLIDYHEEKFLGVCYQLSQKFNVELGAIRLATVGSVFISFGLTLILYFGLWIFFALKD